MRGASLASLRLHAIALVGILVGWFSVEGYPMGMALRIYEQLTEAGEDRARAKVIADGFEQLEQRTAPLQDVATQGHLRETELRLQKEIETVRLEIRECELRLQKEIEDVRLEIQGVPLEMKGVEAQGEKNRADLVRWVVGVGLLQSTLVVGVLLKVAHLI